MEPETVREFLERDVADSIQNLDLAKLEALASIFEWASFAPIVELQALAKTLEMQQAARLVNYIILDKEMEALALTVEKKGIAGIARKGKAP